MKKIIRTILPILILSIAVISAFAFKGYNETIVLETGWINLPGNPCAIEVQCNNTPSDFICNAFYNGTIYQAFGKPNPNILICNKILWRAW